MTEHGAPPSIGSLLWPVANFVLFTGLLWYLLPGPVREFFRERGARLRAALTSGARALSEAEAVRAELERDVRELPATCATLRGDIRATADRQRTSLVEIAQRAAERIRADARLLAEHEVVAARQALRAEVVDEAVRQATAQLREAIHGDDQERLVRDFVQAAGTIR